MGRQTIAFAAAVVALLLGVESVLATCWPTNEGAWAADYDGDGSDFTYYGWKGEIDFTAATPNNWSHDYSSCRHQVSNRVGFCCVGNV